MRDYIANKTPARGEYSKIAKFLGVHSTLVSQVFNGDKELSIEQSFRLTEYFGFNEKEKDIFMLMVQYNRAGTQALKIYFKQRLDDLRLEQKEIRSRVSSKTTSLDEKTKAIFYSEVYYSIISLLSSIPKYQSREAIAEFLNLPRQRVNEICNFLVQHGLCTQKGSKFEMGVKSTFVDKRSPFFLRHHTNWRLLSLEKAQHLSTDDMLITAPMTLSKEDFLAIKEELLEFISNLVKRVKQTDPEMMASLNLDFMEIRSVK